MLKLFLPDRQIENYRELTPEFLKERGIVLLFTDVDNTLVPYSVRTPTEDAAKWISEMRAAGIEIALLSNNNEARVSLFNESLNAIAVPKSGKPKKGAVKKVLSRLGVEKERAALLGDQLFTDVLCGKRAGLYTILTRQIDFNESRFIKFKRLLEIPIRKILKLHIPTKEEKKR